jgi:hypothetical protein
MGQKRRSGYFPEIASPIGLQTAALDAASSPQQTRARVKASTAEAELRKWVYSRETCIAFSVSFHLSTSALRNALKLMRLLPFQSMPLWRRLE